MHVRFAAVSTAPPGWPHDVPLVFEHGTMDCGECRSETVNA